MCDLPRRTQTRLDMPSLAVSRVVYLHRLTSHTVGCSLVVVLTGHRTDTEDLMDQRELNRALSKALAYQRCGKHAEATEWAEKLVEMLRSEGLLGGAVHGAAEDGAL